MVNSGRLQSFSKQILFQACKLCRTKLVGCFLCKRFEMIRKVIAIGSQRLFLGMFGTINLPQPLNRRLLKFCLTNGFLSFPYLLAGSSLSLNTFGPDACCLGFRHVVGELSSNLFFEDLSFLFEHDVEDLLCSFHADSFCFTVKRLRDTGSCTSLLEP